MTGSFLLTPLTSAVARRLGILDHPMGGHKSHDAPTPYLGGVAIFGAVVMGGGLLLAFPSERDVLFTRSFPLALAVAVALALVGLTDDIRPLPRVARLLAQGAAAYGAWFFDFRVSIAPWEWANIALTVVWIVGMTNAFNLLDNMDGLTAGLGGVAALSFGALGLLGDLTGVSLIGAALAGACFGFLSHNRHPAKAFMGDAGSTFIGFTLALLGMRLQFDNLVQVTFLVPVVVLGIPIFDTTLVVVSRLLHGRPVFLGGRDHVSHRLVRVGLPVTAAVGLLYWAGLCLGWLGFVISRSPVEVGWMLLGFVIALGLFFGSLLLRVPTYDEEPQAVDLDDRAIKREGVPYLEAVDNLSEKLAVEREAGA
ncbi:MAG: undecaprenyl/decaprenyl-phosphate alpha-N-acetylglucosaminyl 1-phosphate transferase [Actinomycetota bacterium]|nr:undecaprenyl/decaprenyl-phosphate alpha-N-acetylglucosaminyl 1-phosphate transferase [Actinomycetota bacterium]